MVVPAPVVFLEVVRDVSALHRGPHDFPTLLAVVPMSSVAGPAPGFRQIPGLTRQPARTQRAIAAMTA